jgi:hypothetical protein
VSREGPFRTEAGEWVGDASVGFRWVESVWRAEDVGSSEKFRSCSTAQGMKLAQKKLQFQAAEPARYGEDE